MLFVTVLVVMIHHGEIATQNLRVFLATLSLGAAFFPSVRKPFLGTVVPKTFGGQLCGTFGVTVVLGNYGQQLARKLLATGFQKPFRTGGFCHETVAQSTGHHFPVAPSGL